MTLDPPTQSLRMAQFLLTLDQARHTSAFAMEVRALGERCRGQQAPAHGLTGLAAVDVIHSYHVAQVVTEQTGMILADRVRRWGRHHRLPPSSRGRTGNQGGDGADEAERGSARPDDVVVKGAVGESEGDGRVGVEVLDDALEDFVGEGLPALWVEVRVEDFF